MYLIGIIDVLAIAISEFRKDNCICYNNRELTSPYFQLPINFH